MIQSSLYLLFLNIILVICNIIHEILSIFNSLF